MPQHDKPRHDKPRSRAFKPRHDKPRSKLVGCRVKVKFELSGQVEELPGSIVKYSAGTKRWHIKLDACSYCSDGSRHCKECNWRLDKRAMNRDVTVLADDSPSNCRAVRGRNETPHPPLNSVVVISDSEDDGENGVAIAQAASEGENDEALEALLYKHIEETASCARATDPGLPRGQREVEGGKPRECETVCGKGNAGKDVEGEPGMQEQEEELAARSSVQEHGGAMTSDGPSQTEPDAETSERGNVALGAADEGDETELVLDGRAGGAATEVLAEGALTALSVAQPPQWCALSPAPFSSFCCLPLSPWLFLHACCSP
jgi:hypothetical protein